MLTAKNKAALDLYLSEDPECKGNGTKCWQRVYGTKKAQTASANFHRLLRHAEAAAYLEMRDAQIEEHRLRDVSYGRDRYMADLRKMLDIATQTYVGRDGRRHMEDLRLAKEISKDLYAAETNNVSRSIRPTTHRPPGPTRDVGPSARRRASSSTSRRTRCSLINPADVKRMPQDLRDRLPAELRERGRVYLRAVPPEGRELLWTQDEEALEPLADAGKLGAVLFQFPPWFRKNRTNCAYLRVVAERAPWPVAVGVPRRRLDGGRAPGPQHPKAA